MLRTPVSKQNSIRVITVLIALILMATIWPMRLYKENFSYVGGQVIDISEPVTEFEDAGEYFTAQYDHLDRIEVYIESVEQGEYLSAQLFDPSDNNARLANEKVAFPDEDLPGYVTIEMDVDLTPGNVYILTLSGSVDKADPSTFRVGFESAVEAQENPNAPLYNVAFHNDTGISGLALAMRVHYVEPLTKTKSAAAAILIWVLAMVLVFLESRYYKRRPQADRLLPLQTVLRACLTPVIVILGVLGMIAVFPLRLYDSRVLDVLIYEIGIIIAALYLLYLLWRDHTGLPELFESGADALAHLPQILMVLDVAWILQNACTYMNAVNDYTHRDCEARIVIGLSLLILLLGRMAWNLNRWTILAAIAGLIGGIWYYRQHALGIDVHEYLEQNTNLANTTVSRVFLLIAAVSVLVMLVSVGREHRLHADTRTKTSMMTWVFRAVVAAFLVLTAICRNGRDWLLLLAVVWGLLYLRYAYSSMREHSGQWLRVISYGVILHFVCNVVWTMLHRYYLAYNYSRFSMQFHTVTITAYYLLIVSAAALSLFLMRYREVYTLPRRERLRRLAPEIGILGTVCSYMVMSMTRAGVYSLAVMVLVGVVVTFAGGTNAIGAATTATAAAARAASTQQAAPRISPVKAMVKGLVTIVLIAVLTFPSIFTGQRLISTTAANPVLYTPVEEYFDVLMRHTPWNSTEFMNIEIFLRDSLDRLAGGGIGSKFYYKMKWNIPQGYDVADAGAIVSGEAQVAAAHIDADYDAWMRANGITAGSYFASTSETLIAKETVIAEEEEVLTNEDGSLTDEVIDSITTGNYTGNGLSNGRTEIWREYLSRMNLTGHEGMDITLPNGELAIHAHNILVQMMYDCGIPAGILFACVLFVVFAGSAVYYMRHKGGALALFPLLLAIGFILTGMVEWIYQFDNPYTIMILMILAPILFGERHQA